MDFLLIAFLTLLNGVFAMSELALASSRKIRLMGMAEAGDRGAQAALQLLGNPTQFLSSVQVGITSIGMLNGILGEAAFSSRLAVILGHAGMPTRVAEIAATAIVITLITYITIVFGELVPKRIGQLYPEPVARWVSRPMVWVARIAAPFVRLLSMSTHAVLRLLRVDNAAARSVTEEEITASLEEGLDAGVIERQEHRMVQNVFHLDDRPLTSLMVPRSDIAWFDADATVSQCLKRAGSDGDYGSHSWYPVCRGSLDDVVGIISVARLLELGFEQEGTIERHALPASFLPETLSGMELLEQFRAQSGRLVFVVDEYGVVQGLMTPRDILEAITGELQPGAMAEAWAILQPNGSWILDGLMPLGELKSRLDIRELPDESQGRYNTLGGMLLSESGRLPVLGEKIECADWLFEVTALDGRRIDKVHAFPVIPAL
jgi:putative hemolysin